MTVEVYFAKEIQDILKDVKILHLKLAASRANFKTIVKNKTKSHFDKLSKTLTDAQKPHSLRAFPHFKNTGMPQDYLLHPNMQNIITGFRLVDVGLGNCAAKPIKQCPVCKVGYNTEAHLVFQCTAVHHLRVEWKFAIATQTDDPDPMLQVFLNVNGLIP